MFKDEKVGTTCRADEDSYYCHIFVAKTPSLNNGRALYYFMSLLFHKGSSKVCRAVWALTAFVNEDISPDNAGHAMRADSHHGKESI